MSGGHNLDPRVLSYPSLRSETGRNEVVVDIGV